MVRCLRGSASLALFLACLSPAASWCGPSHGPDAAGLVRGSVAVPPGDTGPPFNVQRTLLVPVGWHAEVWARVDGARFAVWAPDRRLLVSVPSPGEGLLLE